MSFGAEYGPGDDPSDFNPLDERYAAVAPDGSIMVAHREEYRIEAWSRDGQLVHRFRSSMTYCHAARGSEVGMRAIKRVRSPREKVHSKGEAICW